MLRYFVPILFGLAMSIKQTPWLLLPFLLVAIGWEEFQVSGSMRSAIRRGSGFLGVSLLSFGLTNLPFLIQSPAAWFKGITTPFVGNNVPAGEGLVSLSLFLHLGGGSLFAYTVLGALTMLVVFVIFAMRYNALKGWMFVLPSIPLALTSRSFGSYLVMLALPGLVAQTSGMNRGRLLAVTKRELRLISGGIAVIGLVAIYTLTRSSPLSVSVSSIHTSGQLATVDKIQVTVKNRTSRPLTPRFTADEGGSLTAFWQILSGPNSLKPLESATYTLGAPNYYAMPSLTGGFQMVAFTTRGAVAISHSGAYVPALWHLALNPVAVDHSVPYGHSVTFTAQIVDRYNRPVDVSGIAVYMGQIIYAQRGLLYGEAIINQGHVGQTPVLALTNRNGQATFTVTDSVKESDPIYFEANLVNSNTFYPYGYSQIVPVRF